MSTTTTQPTNATQRAVPFPKEPGTRKGYCCACHCPIIIEDGQPPICQKSACFVAYLAANRQYQHKESQ